MAIGNIYRAFTQKLLKLDKFTIIIIIFKYFNCKYINNLFKIIE